MSTDLFTVFSHNKLVLADEIMGWARVRHVPVVDRNNQLVGLISHRDLLKASISSLAEISKDQHKEIMGAIPTERVMKSNPLTISPEDSVQEAARIMRTCKIGCLPVVENGNFLVGIITASDMLFIVEQMTEIPDFIEAENNDPYLDNTEDSSFQ